MKKPRTDSDRIRQDAKASGASRIFQAGRDIHISDTNRDTATVSVRPPTERLDQEPEIRGRESLVEELIWALDHADSEPRVRVLHGLGGVGKTSVALMIARHAQSRDIPVWWVSSADAGVATRALRSIAIMVGANPDVVRECHPADILWRLLDTNEGSWLLVFDEVDAPNETLGEGNAVTDATGLLRPVHGSGLVVVTTREGSPTVWGSGRSKWLRLHPVKPLSAYNGSQVLLDLAGESAGNPKEASVLARRLGGLPLAMRLAGSFLAEAARLPVSWDDGSEIRTFGRYQEALNDLRFEELLGPIGEDVTLDEKQSRALIGRTWELSLELLTRQGIVKARPLLRLLSCFEQAPLDYKKILSPDLLSRTKLFSGITGRQLQQAIEALAGVGLVNGLFHDRHEQKLSMHPLVREVGRRYVLRQPNDLLAEYWNIVASLVFRAMEGLEGLEDPGDPTGWSGWQAIAPHCVSPLRFADDARILPFLVNAQHQDEILIPAKMCFVYLERSGQYTDAEAVAETLLRWQRKILGLLAAETLVTEANLAYLRQQRGDHVSAEATYAKLLHLLPSNHPVILSVRHNRAALLRDRGDLDAAEREYQAVLRIRRRERGNDDSLTLRVLHCLADIQYRRGELSAARRAYESILMRFRRIHGASHRQTLVSQDNLALVLRDLGDLDAAEKESRTAVEGLTKMLGADHLDTLLARFRNALIMADNGDLTAAGRALPEIVEALEKAIGADHPLTVESRNSLAGIRNAMASGNAPPA